MAGWLVTARFIVGDVLEVLPTLGSVTGRSAELLVSLPTVESLDLLGDSCHALRNLGPTHSSSPAGTPRLDVGLGNEDARAFADERDVSEFDRLDADRIGPVRSLTCLDERQERLVGFDQWQDEPMSAGRSIESAQFQGKVGLASLDAQERSKGFKNRSTRCGVNLPDIDRAAATAHVGRVDIGMASEVTSEQFNGFRVDLLDRASGLIGRLFRVGPLARTDLVPIDVDPDVSIGIHDSGHIRDISVHSVECTTSLRREEVMP